jgi:hypothetical protein
MTQVFEIDESVVGVLNFPNNREEAQVFKYEDHEFMENLYYAYNPEFKNEYKNKSNYG